MSAPISSGHDHLPVLDGFRGLSILAVLAAHMLPLGPKVLQLNGVAALMGMSTFFALSGFLITKVLYEGETVPVFLVRRAARIVPLVLVVSIAYALFLEGRPDTFFAANLYLLNYWTSAITPATSPLWSLGVEMHFYLAIALAFALFGRFGLMLLPIGAMLVTGLRISEDVYQSIHTHLRVDEIMAGGLLALAWLNRTHPAVERVFLALPRLFWLLFVLWVMSCSKHFGPLMFMRPYLCALMIGSTLPMVDTWQTRLLSTRALAYIAAISFALYAIHSPFRAYWFNEGSDNVRYLVKRPLAFICIFTLAHLSTFYLERPITRAARRFGRKPPVERQS